MAEGKNTVVRPEATPISKAAEQRARAALPSPPTMMATKLGMISDEPMVGCSPSCPTAKHAGEAGEIDAQAEIHVAQDADIDAEHRDGFEIERAGADADAEPR